VVTLPDVDDDGADPAASLPAFVPVRPVLEENPNVIGCP
jgi:hypothetical protein